MKFFISLVEIILKNRYFQKFRFILNPFNRKMFLIKRLKQVVSKFWFTSFYFNREVFFVKSIFEVVMIKKLIKN